MINICSIWNTVICKNSEFYFFVAPNAGTLVKSQCWLSGQIPTLALWSNPNAGSPVKSQCWLSSQIPMLALRSNPNAGSLVKSQHRLSGQIPLIIIPVNTFIILKFICNIGIVLLNIPVLSDNICSYLNVLGYNSSRNSKSYNVTCNK